MPANGGDESPTALALMRDPELTFHVSGAIP